MSEQAKQLVIALEKGGYLGNGTNLTKIESMVALAFAQLRMDRVIEAVLEEREACAKIAENWSDNAPGGCDGGQVAALIRGRLKP